MATIITHIDSPRLRYVLTFLSEFFSEDFVLNGSAPHSLVYGNAPEGDGFFIRASGLLTETGVRTFEPEVSRHPAGFPVLFANDGPLGFDLFSAIFYLLSRYEEYVRPERDEYGRFNHRASLAFRHGFLQRPLIHEWLAHFSILFFGAERLPEFQFRPTYDIDMAWSYRHKGLLRNAGGLLRALGKPEFGARIAVLTGRRSDPFDAYQQLREWHRQYYLQPVFFILCARNRGQYDKNIPPHNPAMTRLIRWLGGFYTVALHPSWSSGDDPKLIVKEKNALQQALRQKVHTSRQHYIRFTLPHTFRHLLAAGIRDDYSMGYGSINGYRASVSVPFWWYDLEREQQTALRLHPFCFMDANAHYEQRQDLAATQVELRHYLAETRRWGGTLCTVWHNSFLGSGAEFAGWSDLYGVFLAEVSAAG